MSDFLSIIENNTLQNSRFTMLVKEKALIVDEKLQLESNEKILVVYSGQVMTWIKGGSRAIVVQTNEKIHLFYDNDLELHVFDLESVQIKPGIFKDGVEIKLFLKNKHITIAAYKAIVLVDYDTNIDNTTTENFVKRNFDKIEYPPELNGFRINQHLNYLIDRLDDRENVLFLFTGLAENFNNSTTACAVTTTGDLIFASRGALVGSSFKRIKLSDIREISVYESLITNNVVVETLTEKFAVNLSNQSRALRVSDILRKYNAAFGADYFIDDKKPKSELSAADEIKKFKSLLDDVIITEEEFQEKKKQLLGL